MWVLCLSQPACPEPSSPGSLPSIETGLPASPQVCSQAEFITSQWSKETFAVGVRKGGLTGVVDWTACVHFLGLCGTSISKYHKPGGFKQQKFILSQSWRLEVQNQGVNRAILPQKPIAQPFLAFSYFLVTPWLVGTQVPSLPLSSHGHLLIKTPVTWD